MCTKFTTPTLHGTILQFTRNIFFDPSFSAAVLFRKENLPVSSSAVAEKGTDLATFYP
jgi:hypothetical protein